MYDVVIIGAGVVGASIARELSRYDLSIAVLEAGSDVAAGSSGANSGIVHAGYDCNPGTLMARLNVKGNAMFDQISRELDVPFKRNGSLVLAFNEEDISQLEHLKAKGEINGVEDLKILSAEEVLKLEPNINTNVIAALWAPTGGIVCPYGLTIAMAENAADNGVEFYFDNRVVSIDKRENGKFYIETTAGKFISRYVINAAGANADIISNMVGDDSFNIHPRKGEYCLYDRKWGNMVERTIFQPPSAMGKGVLVTPTVDGNLLIGPNAFDTEKRDDNYTSAEGLDFVYNRALESVPSLPRDGVITVFAGLRAIADAQDFIIRPSYKVEGFIQAAGICSPGLTAAPAIAEEVAAILSKVEGGLEYNKDFNPVRKGIKRFRDMDWNARAQMVKEDPRYGRIVCRCETVTEGEIVQALHTKLPVNTIDGIKRRTRAGMGRCQGGFCTPRIMEIIERELGIPMEYITKKGGSSRIVYGRIKDLLEEGEE
ncbi:MAG: NAD(P)/FAD-dependent oxidoreductase [Clostridiales bacterium]|nr:NAD(P)/FAD-dependent oxidoreductase [Clostridiales bacterium]